MINEIIPQQKEQFQQKKQNKQIDSKQSQAQPKNQTKSQNSPQSKNLIHTFLKNSIGKDKNLIATLSQVVTQFAQKSMQTYKIKPVLLINKIQQSRPTYKNSIINKELAYDVLLQTQKTIKIKNCITPLRPNSQIYKRLSKSFFQNLKNGIDQCILFAGTESGPRVQSSIGNQNNPGIFMIVAIAILDEKYKQNHERFDAQFSFLEYRGQKMYDLINYTQVPLTPKINETKSNSHRVQNVNLGEHYVKVSTFLQFIRLFKIALFNNGERDIKTNKDKSVEEIKSQKTFEYMSTFIMKIRIKKYDTDCKMVFEQETMLIDLDQNCSFRNKTNKDEKNFNQSQKQLIKNQRRTSQLTNRTLLDFILIEINNSNPLNKPIHYHMVEKNLLLEIIKKYLRVKESILPKNINVQQQNSGNKLNLVKQQPKQYQVGGYLFVINSFTPNPYVYQKNIKFYQSLSSSVGQQWQAIVKVENIQKVSFNQPYVQNILNQIIYTLKNQKYTSFKDLFAAKQFFTDQSKKIIQDIKLYRNLIFDYSAQKKSLIYNKNLLTAYQFQLIGKCIKSDNFKQFYTSKSYLALPRQIEIKTQKIKNLIKDQTNLLKVAQEKFYLLKKKQHQNRKSFKIPDFVKNKSQIQDKQKARHSVAFQKSELKMQNTKFKMISLEQNQQTDNFNSFQKFVEVKKYVYDVFNQISHRIIFDEQRTIAQQYIFEENLAKDIRNVKQSFKIFIKQVQSIDEAKIKYFSDEPNQQIQNLNKLMRTVHLSKKLGVMGSRSSKFLTKEYSASQKRLKIKTGNLSYSKLTLPKIYELEKLDNIKQKSISSKNNKQKNLIQIKGKINFGSMLLNPKKLA